MKWIENLFKDNAWKHWHTYKNLFHITVFRYLVTWFAVVPIIATVLSSLPKSIHLIPGRDYSFNMRLSFTWEFLWIASLLFVLAYLLYIASCPQFIKKYASLKDYKADLHSPRWLVWMSRDLIKDQTQYQKFFDRMSTKNYFVQDVNQQPVQEPVVTVQTLDTKLRFTHNGIVYSFSMPIIANGIEDKVLTDIAEREVFWEVFGRLSSSKKTIRFIIIFLLYLSALSFSVVFVEHIISGFKYFF